MAKAKTKRLQIMGVDREKKNLKFPASTTKQELQIFKTVAQRMVRCQLSNTQMFPTDLEYLATAPENIRKKFQVLGVSFADQEDDQKYYLSNVSNEYIASKRGTTETKLLRTAKRLEKYFGRTRDVRTITKTDALKWFRWLVESEGLKETSTARRTAGYAREIFGVAVEDEILMKNVFASRDIPKNVQTDTNRWFDITEEIAQKIFSVLANDEERLVFLCLYRLGMRAPSELNTLRWDDVDFENKTVLIRSTKTKHDKYKGLRTCPIHFPDLLDAFENSHESRKPKAVKVFRKISNKNLRKKVIGWLGRAGVDPWEMLLTNFRRAAVTNASNIWPSHVVAAYFGHSEQISINNYRIVRTMDGSKAADVKPLLKVKAG